MTGRARHTGVAAALVIVLALGGLSACGNDTDAAASRRDVYRSLTDRVIVPGYERLDLAASDLAASVAALCSSPDDARVRAAREAWVRTWRAWNRLRPFRFGPLTDRRTVSDIAFMIDPDKVDAVLAGSEPAAGPPFTPESVAGVGADTRGLVAIEHLLFTRDPGEADTCAYASASSAVVAAAADDARAAWADGVDGDGPFADELRSANGADTRAVLDDLVNGITMSVNEISKDLVAAEEAPGRSRDPSGHVRARLRDTLAGVRDAYLGAGREGPGVGELVAAASAGTDERIRTRLDRAEAALAALPVDLDDASDREIRQASARTRALGTVLIAEVASLLGVTLGLGDADGDS